MLIPFLAAAIKAPLPPGPPPLDVVARRVLLAADGNTHILHSFVASTGQLAVNLVIAAVILIAAYWGSRWMAGLVRRAVRRLNSKTSDRTLETFAASLARWIVIVMGLVAVLEQLGVRETSIIAVLGAASLAIGLALQGALGNVAAGVMLLLFRPYRVGDLVEVGGRMGTVKMLDLFVTEMATLDNLKVVAPNGKIFGDVIINYTTPKTRRVDVTFHIGPRQDLKAVLGDMQALLAEDRRVLKDPKPSFEANALTELYAEGVVRAWCKSSDYVGVKTMIVLAVQSLSIAQCDSPPPPAEPQTQRPK